MAGIVGAALAVSGAAMQAVFRNPLAEPGITGVGAGAASFAVLAIVTGLTSLHPLLMPGGAFVGAIAATLVVQLAGTRSHRSSTGALLLVGIALNSFLGALIAAMIANAPNAEDARSAMFWLNGDLTGRTMRDVALATAGAVATTGAISFVGLVVPHLVRLVVGANHMTLLPASAIFGAAFLIVADTAARMAFQPVSLQTGVITSLIGAHFLLFLVLRLRSD